MSSRGFVMVSCLLLWLIVSGTAGAQLAVFCDATTHLSAVQEAQQAAFFDAAGASLTVIDFDTDLGGNPIPGNTVLNGNEWEAVGVRFSPLVANATLTIVPSAPHIRSHSEPNQLVAQDPVPQSNNTSLRMEFSTPVAAIGFWLTDSEWTHETEGIVYFDEAGAELLNLPVPAVGYAHDDTVSNYFVGVVSMGDARIARVDFLEAGPVEGDEGVGVDDIQFSTPDPASGQICGTVSSSASPLGGVTVDLLNASGALLASQNTDEYSGTYGFGDLAAGPYRVEIVTPLGYRPSEDYPTVVEVTLGAGEMLTVDFQFEMLELATDARSPGYWKHQYKVHQSGKGHADEAEADLEAYQQSLFDRFFERADEWAVAITGVTYSDGPAVLCADDAMNTLSLGGGQSMYDKACRQYLALLLNVVSEKVYLHQPATEYGSTMSQVILYVRNLLSDGDPANDELAKNLSEDLNHNLVIPDNPVPGDIPNISFRRPMLATSLRMSRAWPSLAQQFAHISFRSPAAGLRASLSVYDAQGRLVRTLFDGQTEAGVQRVVWDTRDAGGCQLADGVYFYHLCVENSAESGRIIVTR